MLIDDANLDIIRKRIQIYFFRSELFREYLKEYGRIGANTRKTKFICAEAFGIILKNYGVDTQTHT